MAFHKYIKSKTTLDFQHNSEHGSEENISLSLQMIIKEGKRTDTREKVEKGKKIKL